MIDSQQFGFAKLVPGFDFLQNLSQAAPAALPQMPDLSHWVAPTLDLDELDKRIQEFKAVQFWLEQNAKALAATIQALEVQKMTLATLKGMNYQMADLAEAMKIKPQPPASASTQAAGASPGKPAGKTSGRPAAKSASRPSPSGAAAGVVDPMQWWGSITQQFQQIASQALQDVAQQGAAAASSMASGASGGSSAGAKSTATATAKSTARSRKAAARKPAAASTTRPSSTSRPASGSRR